MGGNAVDGLMRRHETATARAEEGAPRRQIALAEGARRDIDGRRIQAAALTRVAIAEKVLPN